VEAKLVTQLVPHLMRRAPLFAGLLRIVGEPLADQGQDCVDDGLGPGLGHLVAWHGVAFFPQILADRLAGKAEFAGDTPLGPTLHQMQASDNVFVDNLNHLVGPPVDGWLEAPTIYQGWLGWSTFRPPLRPRVVYD
jgi:hypothetical protein